MDRTEQLMREWEQITVQITHWDSLSWQTNQFFLAIEGLFFAGIGQLLYSELEKAGPSHGSIVIMLLVGVLFNLAICGIWFRVNRRNREYLNIRFKRAHEIESEPDMAMHVYTQERDELTKPEYRKHSTKNLEKHIPTVFAMGWIIIAIAAIATLFY